MRHLEKLCALLGFVLAFCATCATYTLYPPCDSDADCEEGSVCVEGECRPLDACTTDADCTEPGFVCIDGHCQAPECSLDDDCAPDQRCIDHHCTDCNCQTDADCPLDEFCYLECVCRDREVVPCDSDEDCAEGELCIDSACVPAPLCERDADCPPGLVCDGGVCVHPCETDDDCGMFHLCVDGHCLQQCLSDALCLEPGTICENNLCVPAECTQDSDCTGETGEYIRCRNGRCESYTPCETNEDCGDPNFICTDGACEELPTCSFDNNCGPEETCIDGHCHPATPCQTEEDCPADRDCIGGVCLPHACRGPEDCPGDQVCVAGECIDPGNPDAVYSVVILTPGGPIRSGQQIQLVAIALNQAGDEVPGIAFDWESSQPARAAVSADGVLTGGDEAGSTQVTATARGTGRSSRPVAFLNMLNPGAATLRVVAVWAAGRAPVEGATVLLEWDAGSLSLVTDAEGTAVFPAPDGAASVHVFSEVHDYVSVFHTASRDLLIPLDERTDGTKAGGFVGSMTVSGEGMLSLGLAGLSVAGDLVDLDFGKLLGQTFNVTVDLMGYSLTLPLPAQMTMGASLQDIPIAIKDSYNVLGQRGLRTAWALGGRLDISVLSDLFSSGSITDVLSLLLPMFSLMNHGLLPTYDVFPLPLVPDADDVDGDADTTELRPDWDNFRDVDLSPTQPQSLSVQVSPPALPAGTGVQNAIYLAGGLSALGFTPLGLTGQGAGDGGLPALVMKMAPAYGGLEVTGYAVLVIGYPSAAGPLMPSNLAGVIHTSQTLPTNVTFESDFLAFPEDAHYDATSRTLAATGVSGATLFRSTLQSSQGRWKVYLPAADPVAFSLPVPPEEFPDLAQGATVTLDPIALESGTLFDDLITFNGDDLDRMNELAVAFSRFEFP
jgi:hypothetical protein